MKHKRRITIMDIMVVIQVHLKLSDAIHVSGLGERTFCREADSACLCHEDSVMKICL